MVGARTSTVFFEQWFNVINNLPLKERDKAYRYIFEYSFYGKEPEQDKTDKTSMSYIVFLMAKPNVDSAQKRYDFAKVVGQKGGRPKKVTDEVVEKIKLLRKNGLTQKEVASQLCLSLKTIQRVEKDISQNHNVNVNDNINVNINDNVASKDDDIGASPENNNSLLAFKGKTLCELSDYELIQARNLFFENAPYELIAAILDICPEELNDKMALNIDSILEARAAL